MRHWQVAALSLALFSSGCSAEPAVPDPSPAAPLVARPTPSAPTPRLPVARPVASPSPSASAVAAQAFVLQSSAFGDGGVLPSDFTCDGPGQSPPLAWSGAPPATAAFTLVEQDTDRLGPDPNGLFTMWLLYNMPASVGELQAGVPARPLLANGVQQGLNDAQSVGYLGACPEHGQPPHHLVFSLFAQEGFVTLETGAAYASVRDALVGHTLAQAKLTATVQR